MPTPHTTSITYDWYHLIDSKEQFLIDQLQQGDILRSVPIFVPDTLVESKISGDINNYDCVVLSQSCDIENLKIKSIILSPIHPLSEYIALKKITAPKAKLKEFEKLVDGTVVAYHILNKCEIEGFEFGYQIVDLKDPKIVPIAYLEKILKTPLQRIRLNPPYREQLSQAFARVFM